MTNRLLLGKEEEEEEFIILTRSPIGTASSS